MEWWNDNGGFFGAKYMLGDNSLRGYLPGQSETLDTRTNREVEGIIDLLDIKGFEKIIDVPCGYGRHSIALANKGFDVIGYDINEEHLTFGQKLIKKQILHKQDMRYLPKDDADIVLNLFFSFGFFNDEENFRVMQGFYNSLKVGGQVLIHTNVSPEMIQYRGIDYKPRVRPLADNKTLIINESYNSGTKRLEGTWTIKEGDKETKLTPFSVRIYTAEEFKQLAQEAGFTTAQTYGSFIKEDFTPSSSELILVGRK